MNRISVSFPLALASVLMLAGCGANSNGSPAGETAKPATQAAATSTVSKYDAGPRAGESPADEAKAEAGEKLFSSKGCTACHAFGKKLNGPDLAGVTMRRTAEWMENQILDPTRMVKEDPISHDLFAKHALQMPDQGLTQDEARAVIEYFKHKDHEANESGRDDASHH